MPATPVHPAKTAKPAKAAKTPASAVAARKASAAPPATRDRALAAAAGADDAVHPPTLAAWRRWLARHHARERGVWLVGWKKASGREALAYDDVVTEALAFGWVDSKTRALDAGRSMLWFAPRKPRTGWSRPNQQRVERLIAEGRMHAAGMAKVQAAKADGSWHKLDAVEDGVVPDDLAAAFDAHRGARAHWDAFPRSVRRGILEWIVQAKKTETRAARIDETARRAALGERANQWARKAH